MSSSGRPRKIVVIDLRGQPDQRIARLLGQRDEEADDHADGQGGKRERKRDRGSGGDFVAPAAWAEFEKG